MWPILHLCDAVLPIQCGVFLKLFSCSPLFPPQLFHHWHYQTISKLRFQLVILSLFNSFYSLIIRLFLHICPSLSHPYDNYIYLCLSHIFAYYLFLSHSQMYLSILTSRTRLYYIYLFCTHTNSVYVCLCYSHTYKMPFRTMSVSHLFMC